MLSHVLMQIKVSHPFPSYPNPINISVGSVLQYLCIESFGFEIFHALTTLLNYYLYSREAWCISSRVCWLNQHKINAAEELIWNTVNITQTYPVLGVVVVDVVEEVVDPPDWVDCCWAGWVDGGESDLVDGWLGAVGLEDDQGFGRGEVFSVPCCGLDSELLVTEVSEPEGIQAQTLLH